MTEIKVCFFPLYGHGGHYHDGKRPDSMVFFRVKKYFCSVTWRLHLSVLERVNTNFSRLTQNITLIST